MRYSGETVLQSNHSWLFRFSLFVTVCTLLLILAGGLVTSHDAGLAVPDWPLSYGQFFPPMVGNIFWEHGHRMIAGAVGILTLILAIWVQWSEKRAWIKKLAWVAVGAVVLQALLGGLTVILLLPPAVSIIHACLGQTFFCIHVVLCYFLSNDGFKLRGSLAVIASERNDRSNLGIKSDIATSPKNRGGFAMTKNSRLFIVTTSLVYIQLILGATIRHTSFTVVPHVIVACLVMIHIFLVVARINRFEVQNQGLQLASISLGLITILQFFLGIGAFVFTRMTEQSYAPSRVQVIVTAIHQTNGAAILGMCVLLTIMIAFGMKLEEVKAEEFQNA